MGKHFALLCMSLNIGGAETHIFELAKGLTAKGHTVTVFSNGGVYADTLEKVGIRHVQAPLHRKNLYSLITSYRTLKQEFKKNRPSVVHSHTRISNFVGGLICKRMNIPMVTTVHFNFRVGLFFRWFSNWGTRSLAVSEDLKTYLVDNYNYDPHHVELTVNGIDMDRFKKHDETPFRASLGIAPNEKMILLVSRLDKEASDHVSRYLDVAPAVFKRHPNMRTIIVGSGKLYNEFVQRVHAINKQCGKEFIMLQGARTNIEQYTAAADLFVGISRSALEAMSTGVPTILLGNLGYLGLYSDVIKKECIETNLTCRGYPYPSNEHLINLISECLSGRDLSKEISDGLRLVQEHFSISTMAETALKQYQSAIDSFRPYDYMISGYYGTDNFGDNLTLSILMDHLNGRKGTFLTHNVKKTCAPDHVLKVHRFHLWTIRSIMKKTKVFLLGSGSILQDATSNRSIFYYHFILRMALRYHCKVMLYANGVGPIRNSFNRTQTTKLLNQIDLITARDQESIHLLNKLSIHCPTVLTADDVFSLSFAEVDKISIPHADNRIIVGVNFKLDSKEIKRINEIATALSNLAQRYNLYFYLLPFHYEQDFPALKVLQRKIPQISHLVECTTDPKELIQYIQIADFQIFERFHGQVIATILGTPFLPINYDPKNYSLASDMGMTEYLIDHNDITAEKIESAFIRLWEHQDKIRTLMADYANNARTSAKKNCEYLLKMIEEF